MVLLIILVSFIALNQVGEKFLKRYLKDQVHHSSKGVYTIDFDRFRFNLLTGKSTLTGFRLIPDENRYQELRNQGEVKGTLYSIRYDKLTLSDLNIREILLYRMIHLRMIELDRPAIAFVAFPDSTAMQRGRFRQIYRDIYPLFSALFSEVRIDSILVNEGSLSGKQTNNSGSISQGDWLYSATLREFDLTSPDDETEERVFYSRDVELRIRNFSYILSDSLYFLNAEEVGFSLSGSRLFGKGITLSPNFRAESLLHAKSGSLYQVYLPEFYMDGVDLYKALLDKEITISSVMLDNLEVKMFHHRPEPLQPKRHNPKVTVATLYTIIRDKLKRVTIDTLCLHKASFRFYPSVVTPRPELEVDQATLNLHGFMLDSLAHLDTSRILYAHDIELDLNGFTLALQDKLHDLRANSIRISTRASLIEIREARLSPSPFPDPANRYKSNSLYRMFFPVVRFDRIDLHRLFNSKNLDFERLTVSEPDMTIIQYRRKKALPDTLTSPHTFVENLNLVNHVIMPYMISLRAGLIEISNARISFKDAHDGLHDERISGLADVTITGLFIDTLTYRHHREFLSRVDLWAEIRDFRYLSPDSLYRVSIGALDANSVSRELDVSDFTLLATSRLKPGTDHPSSLSARFRTLRVTGFDWPRWITGNWFYANEIQLEEPHVSIRSVRTKRESSLNEPFAETDEAVRKINVERIRIAKGGFDLAEETEKGNGSLLVRNVDFQLSGFLFDLTGWDEGIKVFRYDMVSLKPDPSLPILFDSSYSVAFTRLLSDSYPPNVTISQLHIVPVTTRSEKSQRPVRVELSLPSFQIRNLDLERALFRRELTLKEILIGEPSITLFHHPAQGDSSQRKNKGVSSHPALSVPFHTVNIGSVALSDGMVRYIDKAGDTGQTMSLDRINTTITGFRYDSSHTPRSPSSLFFCDDIELHTGGYSLVTKDSMNTLSLTGLHLSTRQATLTIDSFAVIPNFSDYMYSRKLGYQTDRMQLTTGKIELKRLDLLTLLEHQKIHAGLMDISGLVLDDYRDKRVEFPVWKRPPMIQQAIRKIPLPVTIDTVKMTNGKVTYREQTGEQPGVISFERMDMLIRGFTSDPLRISSGSTLTARGSTWLMGQARVHGEFRFPLNSPADTFFFSGGAGELDVVIFNPIVARLTPVKIRNGRVDSVNIPWMQGNDSLATGLLELYYQGLEVELLKKKPGFWRHAATDLAQVLVNMAIPHENPGYFGKYRAGYIWNRRNDEKGFFNFYWKSILSGLKSSAGINSKGQREVKKEVILHGTSER